MTNSSVHGIYVHPQSHKILAVTPESAPPGEPWIKLTGLITGWVFSLPGMSSRG